MIWICFPNEATGYQRCGPERHRRQEKGQRQNGCEARIAPARLQDRGSRAPKAKRCCEKERDARASSRARLRRAHTVILSLNLASVFCPMPGTLVSSSTDANLPRSVLYEMIFFASDGPIPSRD